MGRLGGTSGRSARRGGLRVLALAALAAVAAQSLVSCSSDSSDSSGTAGTIDPACVARITPPKATQRTGTATTTTGHKPASRYGTISERARDDIEELWRFRRLCDWPPPANDELAHPSTGTTRVLDRDHWLLEPSQAGPTSVPHELWHRKLQVIAPSPDPGMCAGCPPAVAARNDHVAFLDTKRSLLYDVDTHTGKTRWTYQAEHSPFPDVEFTDDAVVVEPSHEIATSSFGLGYEIGLDPKTGDPYWRVGGGSFVEVKGGQILSHPAGRPPAANGPDGSPPEPDTAEMLHLRSGRRIVSLPAKTETWIGQRNVYVWNGDQFDAYDATSGKRVWTTDITVRKPKHAYEGWASVGEYGSVTIVSVPDDRWFGFDAKTGEQLWGPALTGHRCCSYGGGTRDGSPGWIPIGNDRAIYSHFISGNGNHPDRQRYESIDLRTGRVLWKRTTNIFFGMPEATFGHDLLADWRSDEGVGFKLVDPETGKSLRTVLFPHGRYYAPVVLGQGMAYRLVHGTVTALDLATGRSPWTLDVGNYDHFTVADGVLIVWTDDGIAAFG